MAYAQNHASEKHSRDLECADDAGDKKVIMLVYAQTFFQITELILSKGRQMPTVQCQGI